MQLTYYMQRTRLYFGTHLHQKLHFFLDALQLVALSSDDIVSFFELPVQHLQAIRKKKLEAALTDEEDGCYQYYSYPAVNELDQRKPPCKHDKSANPLFPTVG